MYFKARFLTEIQAKTRNLKKFEIFFKKRLTNRKSCDIINIVVRAEHKKL